MRIVFKKLFKLSAVFFLFIFSVNFCFASDIVEDDASSDNDETELVENASENIDSDAESSDNTDDGLIADVIILPQKAKRNFIESINWIISFEPAFIFNMEKESAPSPIVYPFSMGIIFPNDTLVSFQSRISFFLNDYLLYKGAAYPAEVENRTATVFSFLMDFSTVFTFTSGIRHLIETGAGGAVLARAGILAAGLSGSEKGENGSASDDVKQINRDFWKHLNFLFIKANFSYLFKFNEIISAGPEINLYFPCRNFLISDNLLQNAIISAGFKLKF